MTSEAVSMSFPRELLVWDNHACMPFESTDRWLEELHRYRDAGVSAVTLNIGDAQTSIETHVRTAAAIRDFVRKHPDRYLLVGSVRDIRAAHTTGRLAIALDVEGVYAMGEQLSLIRFYYDIGVRWMLMVYNVRNLAGSGCHDESDQGLTDYGRRIVEEMDRVGMIKCCSHTGYRTALDIMSVSRRPTIFSHSNPLALHAHPRNIPDDLIRACAATAGVVCISGVDVFLGSKGASVERLAEHIDYVAQLVGPEHVGLGTDFVFDQQSLDEALAANQGTWPLTYGYRPGIEFLKPEQLPGLVHLMQRKGYSQQHIRAILGENLLRVAEAVWT